MAKTISCIYKDYNQLNKFIKEYELHKYANVLVQVFSGIGEQDTLRDIQRLVYEFLPLATVVGCTTSGEIIDGQSVEYEIVLSFTAFEKTELHSGLFNLENYSSSFDMGKSIGEKLFSNETKALILISTDFAIDVPSLLEGLHGEKPGIVVAGGIAGDNGSFKEGIVFSEDQMTTRGVVAVALDNSYLRVETYSNYQWQEFGKPIIVTKSKERSIYSLDGKKPLQILKHYLGESFVRGLPHSGLEFPFILDRNGELVSIFVTKLLKNGAIEVNRTVNEGDNLVFAYTHIQAIMEDSIRELKRLSKHGVETIFVYNCLARKSILGAFVEQEIKNLHQIAPTSGFYSYGEIIKRKNRNPQLVSHSFTYLALSENDREKNEETLLNFEYVFPQEVHTIISLTQLMKASQEDMKLLTESLKISEQRKTEEKVLQLAYYDQDTGLPNRLKFTEQLGEFIKRAKKKKQVLAIMVIDMDRFKIINDSLGHDAGDEVLKQLSERIQQVLPKGAYLGRFSGDKFNVVLSKNVNVDEIMKIAKQLLQNVSAPISHSNQEFFVTASIGVSFYPKDGSDEITLLKNADMAMNNSKYPGGNRITFYATEMNKEALIRLEFESYLRKALQKNEFHLCYQPLIDLTSGRVFGSEALIRWNHPKLGLVSPGEFIPLAEETGLIEEIGKWVLKTACRQNKEWQLMGEKDFSISVNVSANQFQQVGFVHDVRDALMESGLEPKYLTLELTESTMLRNIDHSISVMKALQKLGVKVSIDDFGTGYSSLSYLKDLPINTLKIDRSFINNLRLESSDIAIVKAIITMGHGLELKVVAEGVETREQIDLLKELQCHYAQGFFIHKPLSTSDFESCLLKA